jgi:hypothetical protein
LSCPFGFILFNKICYYIHLSFVDNIQNGERLCYNQNSNSTLVKFDSHEWGNINTTRFLGRRYEDILLEFFYYLLEKKLLEQTIDESSGKNWLRLLLGNKNDPNECVLRYFIRSSGAFTTVDPCVNGGHPVCQCEPIRTKISSLSNTNNSSIETTSSFDTSPLSITTMPICENCTTEPLADEEPLNNGARIVPKAQSNMKLTYQPLLVILSGPGLALLILLVGVALLIRHLRKNRGSYSRRSSIIGSHRMKRSSTILTNSDVPGTPSVLYTSLKSRQIPLTDDDMLLPFDNSIRVNSETIELLSSNKVQILNDDENKINDEETFYPTPN